MDVVSPPDSTSLDVADDGAAAAGALADRLFSSSLSTIEVFTTYLGIRLGLHGALADHGAMTGDELAGAAGIAPRYAREWLEQQTVAGFVDCVDRSTEPGIRRFTLPAGHAAVLLEDDNPVCLAPLVLAAAGIAGVLPLLLDAYRTGTGVPYAAYGADFRDGQAGFNRPAYTHLLAGAWLAAAAPDLHARLQRGESVRIADVGCGAGWSSIAFARAYPHARIDGFDVDDASIADARRNAGAAGVADRVTFEVADAADLPTGAYDLVSVFEAIHDMSRPVEVLRAMKSLAAPEGMVIVMDENVADTFAVSDGPIEAFLYGASVFRRRIRRNRGHQRWTSSSRRRARTPNDRRCIEVTVRECRPPHLTSPLPAADTEPLVAQLNAFYTRHGGGPFLLFSPTTTEDLTPFGFHLKGHPPFMIRPSERVGAKRPPSATDVEIVEATTAEAVADFERTLIDAYPAAELSPFGRFPRLFTDDVLGTRWRLFVGYDHGHPVATSAAYIGERIVAIEAISTLPSHRGRGIGASLTAVAVLAEPALPSALVASDMAAASTSRSAFLRSIATPYGSACVTIATPSGSA